jgi:hypothetical protein
MEALVDSGRAMLGELLAAANGSGAPDLVDLHAPADVPSVRMVTDAAGDPIDAVLATLDAVEHEARTLLQTPAVGRPRGFQCVRATAVRAPTVSPQGDGAGRGGAAGGGNAAHGRRRARDVRRGGGPLIATVWHIGHLCQCVFSARDP